MVVFFNLLKCNIIYVLYRYMHLSLVFRVRCHSPLLIVCPRFAAGWLAGWGKSPAPKNCSIWHIMGRRANGRGKRVFWTRQIGTWGQIDITKMWKWLMKFCLKQNCLSWMNPINYVCIAVMYHFIRNFSPDFFFSFNLPLGTKCRVRIAHPICRTKHRLIRLFKAAANVCTERGA